MKNLRMLHCPVHAMPFGIRASLLLLALASAGAAAQDADAVFADGFELPCPGAAPGVTPGTGAALLLRGTVVTPDIAFVGEVLVQGDTIVCAAASCADQAGAATATVVETQGLIFPGLIDASTYAHFDVFDENDWSPPHLYADHDGYTGDARYGALVDAKQYLNGEGSAVDDGCEMDKYSEIKALLAGTTSLVTHATPANRACYASLARTIDESPNDLGADYVQTATLFPTTAAADGVCANFTSGSTHAYLIPIGEGTSAAALAEFQQLGTVTTTDGCLYAPQTAIVDGTALGDAELTTMSQHGMSLVWTPHSDMALYGASANVALARTKGINVALGTNWSITGSHDLLAEMRYADALDDASGDALTAFDLVRMVTTNAAHALALDATLGSIAAGRKADLTVIGGTCSAPWSALVNAKARDVRLVLVGGVPLYGDATLQSAAPATPGCEALEVCGTPKFVCVAESGGTPTNKLGQTLADISGILASDLAAYDDLNLTQWNFAPVTPLVDCP